MERFIEKQLPIRLFLNLSREELLAFVQAANQFQSYILLKSVSVELNAKSVLSMIHIHSFLEGTTICLSARGEDADHAITRLVQVLYTLQSAEKRFIVENK